MRLQSNFETQSLANELILFNCEANQKDRNLKMNTTQIFPIDSESDVAPSCSKTDNNLFHLDLTKELNDTENLIHQYLEFSVKTPEFEGIMKIMDLKKIYISISAKKKLSDEYLNPLLLLCHYGKAYKNKLITTFNRGKHKGVTYIDSSANNYIFESTLGSHFVVKGLLNSLREREIHILTDLE